MTDIFIKDVPEDVIAAIDVKAQRLGLSLLEYVRRVLAREGNAQSTEVSVPDLVGLATTCIDLDDPDVIGGAWR